MSLLRRWFDPVFYSQLAFPTNFPVGLLVGGVTVRQGAP